ncbi:hypothetical protein N7470_002620 [Penicillium chermesinum]|nr:hypothetical protein N7470_002620 [Penicillium chermesinum]
MRENDVPVKRKVSTAGSDILCPGDYENGTEPSQSSGLVENPCSRANDTPERTKDFGTSEEISTPLVPSAVPTVRSTSASYRVQRTSDSNIPVRHPSVAVVVPAPSPSWKQGVVRRSTRAAAVVCKKRLRSGRDICHRRDRTTTFHDTEQPQKRTKKRRLSIRPISNASDASIPVASHCAGAIQGVRGSALLTVESNPGLNPAYFFTFVPEPSPTRSRHDPAAIPRKKREYTSDENALLVRLKEKEAMSWSEITTYFPDRDTPSLQVHYSTKLRHKASSRSGKPRRRK